MDADFVTREQDRMLAELNEFLAIPSVSTTPERAGDWRRAAEWLREHLAKLVVRQSHGASPLPVQRSPLLRSAQQHGVGEQRQ